MLRIKDFKVKSFIIRDVRRILEGKYPVSGKVIYRYSGTLHWKDSNTFYNNFSVHAQNLEQVKCKIKNDSIVLRENNL